jgi:Protein of unknown function (DUF1553)/Protein of unknown function (DUF1549)/Planctomycete cytochrome C
MRRFGRLVAILVLWHGLLTVAPPRTRADAEENKALPTQEAAQSIQLQQEVQALFRSRCLECHAGPKPKGKLNLSSFEGVARGSSSGLVVVPRQLDKSRMWQMILQDKMPPKKPLTKSERGIVRRWIEAGSPGLVAKAAPQAPAEHWAFQTPLRPAAPAVKRQDLIRTEIDRFIEAALENEQLSLAPEASREILIRRVSFDLTGLPPTPAEVDAFLADSAPYSYERMVERYLASPHYGERWGKYWLDAAGYADSNGYFSADSDRPLAYRYRDYVIRSFNEDKPYDRFVREQLAGDELAGYEPAGDVTPAMVEPLIATHFLRNAQDGTGESDGNPDEVRTDRYTVLEGTLQITMSSLLGITIQCARCHDHKFEPITQRDFYSLEAIFFPAYCPDRWTKPADRVVAIGPRAQREEVQRRTESIDRQLKSLRSGLEIITTGYQERLLEERLQSLEPAKRALVLKAFTTAKDKRTAEQQALLQAHAEAVKITDEDLAKRFPEFTSIREPIAKTIAAIEGQRPRPLEKISVLVETDVNPPTHHVLVRGQHNAPGPEVTPGVPAALSTPADQFRLPTRPSGRTSSGRRTALADWITSSENPLFARVMVNRIWQHHFGMGIVATSDNLGQSGSRPSHPELLDFLATEFVRQGWSVKAMHRVILCSAAYRQASAFREDAFERDPENRLLWRFPLRRLDAEAIRDAMLSVAGELHCKEGGAFIPTSHTEDGSVVVDEKLAGARCRSIYLQQRRTQVPTLLEVFDAPSVVTNCTSRNTSTVPLQALALLNSDFSRKRAMAFAHRLDREAGSDLDKRIKWAFRLAYGRMPESKESDSTKRFLTAQQQVYSKEKDGDKRAWVDFCQMLLASNSFMYVE